RGAARRAGRQVRHGGDVLLDGRSIRGLPMRGRVKTGLVRSYQRPIVPAALTVGETLKAARKAYRPKPSRLKVEWVAEFVRNRDARIGACADIGHWATSNLSSVWAIKVLEGRIISVHLKDKSDFGHKASVVVAGKGVVDVDGCLKELIRQKFDGHISVEHENDWKDSVPQVKHNIDFVKQRAK
ncbi:MAG: TIM barrel protein, partial [Verrucomicrobiota bacterium]